VSHRNVSGGKLGEEGGRRFQVLGEAVGSGKLRWGGRKSWCGYALAECSGRIKGLPDCSQAILVILRGEDKQARLRRGGFVPEVRENGGRGEGIKGSMVLYKIARGNHY